MFSKHRVEALSDGVFAIAMTLLVLDLKVPLDIAPGQLGAALKHGGASWVSFIITCALAANFWTFQHQVLDRVERVTSGGRALTFVFLGFVSILPFTTSVWGHHIREPLAFVIYFGNQLALALALTAKVELARVRGCLKPGLETQLLRWKLFGMCAIMATGAATVGSLPTAYQWYPVGFVTFASKAIRLWKKRRLAAAGPEADSTKLVPSVNDGNSSELSGE